MDLKKILQLLSYYLPIAYSTNEEEHYYIYGKDVELHEFKQKIKNHKCEPIAIKKARNKKN